METLRNVTKQICPTLYFKLTPINSSSNWGFGFPGINVRSNRPVNSHRSCRGRNSTVYMFRIVIGSLLKASKLLFQSMGFGFVNFI